MVATEVLDIIGTRAGTAVTSFVAAGAGAYLGGYLKKKGENLATHEGVDKLVTQMAAVAKATKEVEATISKEMWQGKRNWDIKRDALFELVKGLGSVEYALGIMEVSLRLPHLTQNRGWIEQRDKALNGWQEVLENFKRDKMLALMVCGAPLRDALERLASGCNAR